jgi:hypothetical protein
MANWKFRIAEPADAEAFSVWSATNPQIDQKDLLKATGTQNPTVVFFAVEKDGVVQAFAPVYLQMVLAHLGFNPEAEGKDKLRALQMLTDGVSAFAIQLGVREIMTLSKAKYPVAQWAVKHDFEIEPRQALILDLNKMMAEIEVPANVL